MKRIAIFLIVLLFCVCAYAQDADSSKWFIFSKEGPQVSLISQDVSMARMDYAFSSPTAIDNTGNFYYCSSEGNPQGFLWKIRRVDKQAGESKEICRLNLDRNNYGYIRAIEFAKDGSLYVWLAFKKSGVDVWDAALVEIKGLK